MLKIWHNAGYGVFRDALKNREMELAKAKMAAILLILCKLNAWKGGSGPLNPKCKGCVIPYPHLTLG
jgi:hypothetical protein